MSDKVPNASLLPTASGNNVKFTCKVPNASFVSIESGEIVPVLTIVGDSHASSLPKELGRRIKFIW